MRYISSMLAACCVFCIAHPLVAQQIRIPHHQDRPPGPALSPKQAIAKMTVPKGFKVELVAGEPDIVNPVAMTIDERGRFWICESLEYPRRSPGKGRDRVKFLEDTDGDGKADSFTVFADGLNIPSGIAVGHGGVWLANAPDILFLQDTDGDGKADRREVVVTGFGRQDTHELPNSLTWGPDGWLYGLNGVFNHCHVRYPAASPHAKKNPDGFRFTCAMFRIHPRTREFQVFAEGTSNPWGIAFDTHGSAFVSACVIDHLWHITETGYYHRQGGAYPPFTWKIGSIVKHQHQKAAYCGITFFDSDAYPEEYRERLYMGNIHGGCINVDKLQRDGSTYFATGEPDFLTANDAWFMPVVQKTGPDGCLYILDWYDRYHCYQDANRDPKGIDRLRGRLYRVRYKNTPRVWNFDLSQETDDQIIKRLGSPNVYFRTTAQRVLQERGEIKTALRLLGLAADPKTNEKLRRHAFWAAWGGGGQNGKQVSEEFGDVLERFVRHHDPTLRAWAYRFLGDSGNAFGNSKTIALGANDESKDVRLQAAIAIGKLSEASNRKATVIVKDQEAGRIGLLLTVLSKAADDPLTPHIIWQNLHPLLEYHADAFLEQLNSGDYVGKKPVADLMPRAFERILGRREFDAKPAARLFSLVRDEAPVIARQCLAILAQRIQSGEIRGEQLNELRKAMAGPLTPLLTNPAAHPVGEDAAFVAASWRDPRAVKRVQQTFATARLAPELRLRALTALIAAGDDTLIDTIGPVLNQPIATRPVGKTKMTAAQFRGQLLASLGRLNDPKVADVILAAYKSLEPEVKPRAIELLTQRVSWAKRLLDAIGKKQVPANSLNLNQVRRLLATSDKQLAAAVRAKWGTIREERNPDRERIIAQMKQFIRKNSGDPFTGEKVYKKICGQCHKMYGAGAEVGPDITRNGRNSFDQLLSNVFDPSLVIGVAYRAHTVVTTDGRVLTGLLVEDSKQRVVLKVQGGKLETIVRDDIEVSKASKVSMMPEQLEKQAKPQEIADLFAFLTLDKHPSDRTARRLSGVREIVPRSTNDPSQFAAILSEVAPGFSTKAVGEGGVTLLKQHAGRPVVVRTHPIKPDQPCVMTGRSQLPPGKRSRLMLAVAHHAKGDWRLLVKVNGQSLLDTVVGPKTAIKGWIEHSVDLTQFAGKSVNIELHNHPNNWSWEFAYWGRVEIVSE